MATLTILTYPDARLRRKASSVTEFDDELKQLVRDMAETMYEAPGIGLAAVQVNVPKRVIVIDTSEDKSDLLVFINPILVKWNGEQFIEEGCLSVPGIYAPVERAESIQVQAKNEHGEAFEMDAEGLLAVCVQHEMDHLEGKVFVDYLSRLKQNRIRRRMERMEKESKRSPEEATA